MPAPRPLPNEEMSASDIMGHGPDYSHLKSASFVPCTFALNPPTTLISDTLTKQKMPPRLSKRQQRELEELEALQVSPVAEESLADEESEEDVSERPTTSGFAAVRIFDCMRIRNCANDMDFS